MTQATLPPAAQKTTSNGAAHEETAAPTIWQRLREPFEHTSKLTKSWNDKKTGEEKSFEVDYVGHADVTARLLDVDPQWNWEPLSLDEDGLPRMARDQDGDPVGLWIRLTVGGVTRLGFGSVEGGAVEAEKQLIGDALRNAAMRFGVALDLWRKDEDASAKKAPKALDPADDFGLCDQPGCEGRLAAKDIKGKRVVECTHHGYVGKDGKRRGGPCTRDTDWQPNWPWYAAHRDRTADGDEITDRQLADSACLRFLQLAKCDPDTGRRVLTEHGWDGEKKSTEHIAGLVRGQLIALLSDLNGAITNLDTPVPM